MSPKFARFIFTKVLGWHYAPGEDKPVAEDKAIILAAPHTAVADFIIGYLFYRSVGGKLRIMIKKEFFFFPLGALLRSMGGFPIDRSKPSGVIMGVVREMQQGGTFHLCICPEGTRKPVRKWKTGYHSIAMHTGAPVYLGHYDFKTKTAGTGPRVVLTGDPRRDTDTIQAMYASMNLPPKHPEGYVTE